MHLSQLIDREAAAFRDPAQIRITSRVAIDLAVMADETELGRVFANLFENARRYGRSTDTGIAVVTVSYARTGPWVIVSVRDHGPGVAPEKLAPADHALLPRRRGAHRGHRRRPGPGHRREVAAAHGRHAASWPTRPTAAWSRTCG